MPVAWLYEVELEVISNLEVEPTSFGNWMVIKEKEEARMTSGFVSWPAGCVVVASWRQETWWEEQAGGNEEMNFRYYSLEFWKEEVRQCVWMCFEQLEILYKFSISASSSFRVNVETVQRPQQQADKLWLFVVTDSLANYDSSGTKKVVIPRSVSLQWERGEPHWLHLTFERSTKFTLGQT